MDLDLVEEEYQTNILENIETLHYGDVIKLTCKEFKDQVFRVIYIDHHTLELQELQNDKLQNKKNKIEFFQLKEGYFYQNKKQIEIENILLLYRNPLQGFAKQQHFDEGVSLLIVFEKNILIKGHVSKIVNDSITISTLTEGCLFFDFAYKGFPKLPGLENIVLIEKDDEDEEEKENLNEENDEEESKPKNKTKTTFEKDFIFSIREQEEDIFFDTDLITLSRFQQLVKKKQNVEQSNYILIIKDDEENNTLQTLHFDHDVDCLTKDLSTFRRCLKDEHYTPIGVVFYPNKFYSSNVPLMAKSFIHTDLSFLLDKNKYKNVHYFNKEKGFTDFLQKLIPNEEEEEEETKLKKVSTFEGQNCLQNIVRSVLDVESVNVNLLQTVRQLLKKQNKNLFFETGYKYDETIKNKNKLPRKTILKGVFDRLLTLKKQFDSVAFQWILYNKKGIQEEEVEEEKEKEKDDKIKKKETAKSFDVKQYFPGNDTSKIITFAELWSQLLNIDSSITYTSFLALQNVIKPSIKEYIKNVLNSLKNEEKLSCENVIVVSKSYQELKDAIADNDKTIYFDEKFYSSVDNQETRKKVEDGHFAIVSKVDDVIDSQFIYLKRISNKWEEYKVPVDIKDVILSNTQNFCELQPDCIKVNNDCKSITSAETGLNETLLLHMQNQLNTEYHQTWLQIFEKFQFALKLLDKNKQTNKQDFLSSSDVVVLKKNNISKSRLQNYLLNIQNLKTDFILKNNWYVFKKSNVPYIPLIVSYVKEGNNVKANEYSLTSFLYNGKLFVDSKTGFSFKYIPLKTYKKTENNDNSFINKKYNSIFLNDQPIIWKQLLFVSFLPNATKDDEDFMNSCSSDEEDDETSFEHIMSCIFILLQTKFSKILGPAVKKTNPIYKGYPFYTNDFKDNEGLKQFAKEFYDWLEEKRELLPFDKLKTYFEFSKNEKIFVETFCKIISLHIATIKHQPVFLSRVFAFQKELKQKQKKEKELLYSISNWQRFLPELSNLKDFKYQVANFVLKTYVSPETLYVKSLLLSVKYQQLLIQHHDASYCLHLFHDLDRKLEELWFKSSSYIFYKPENISPVFQYSNHYSEETIYRCFLKYCKFNDNCPLYKKLADICDSVSSKPYKEEELFELETTESYNNRVSIELNKFDPIEFKIDKLKENGRKYNQDNLFQLLSFLHNQTKQFNLSVSYPTRTEALRKTISLAVQLYPENEVFEKLNNLLDRFQFESTLIDKQLDSDYKEFIHFISETNNKKIIKILETLFEKTIKNVDDIENPSAKTFYDNFKLYFEQKESDKDKDQDSEKEKEEKKEKELSHFDNLTTQMRNSIRQIASTIPSCILNKHNKRFPINIKKYFDNSSLELKLKTIKEKGNLFIDLFENTCCLTDESIFDLKLTKQLFGYYLLLLFQLFIDNELPLSMLNEFAILFFKDIRLEDKEKNQLLEVIHISDEEKEMYQNFTMTTII